MSAHPVSADCTGPHRQHGAALVISLVLLIVMSLMAVSALSGSRLGERAAGNAQQKAIAFEVAESAIAAGFDIDELVAALDTLPAQPVDRPDAVDRATIAAAIGAGFDQRRPERGGRELASIDVDARLSIQYCGETPLTRGSSLNANEAGMQMVGLLFDVNGVATIPGSATRADHVQRGSLLRPRSGRLGGCTTRGAPAPAAAGR